MVSVGNEDPAVGGHPRYRGLVQGLVQRHVGEHGHAEAGEPLQRAAVAHVHVGVDQSGQQHAAVPVQDRGPRRVGTDAVCLDDHRRGRPQLLPVEHAHVGQGGLPGRARPGRP